jgi:hypothetical protein
MIYVSNLFYNYTYLFSFFAQYEYDDAGLQKNKCAGLPTVAYHFIKVVISTHNPIVQKAKRRVQEIA